MSWQKSIILTRNNVKYWARVVRWMRVKRRDELIVRDGHVCEVRRQPRSRRTKRTRKAVAK